VKAGKHTCYSAGEEHRAVLSKLETGELTQPCLSLGAPLVASDVQLGAACPETVAVMRTLTWRQIIIFQ